MTAFTMTPAAAAKIRSLGSGLRISVRGGGCSGLTYLMDLSSVPQEGDSTFELEGAMVYVDRKSLLFLKGSVLDHEDGLVNAGFKVKNPNAKSTCGCGESFGI